MTTADRRIIREAGQVIVYERKEHHCDGYYLEVCVGPWRSDCTGWRRYMARDLRAVIERVLNEIAWPEVKP